MVIEFALFVFVFIGIMIAIIEIKDFRNLILKNRRNKRKHELRRNYK